MHPILIRIGPLTIHTYGFLVASGFLVGIWLAVRQAKKEGIPPDKIIDLGFYILLAAIIGSRLLFILINYTHYLRFPLDIIKIWGRRACLLRRRAACLTHRGLVRNEEQARRLEYRGYFCPFNRDRPFFRTAWVLCRRLLLRQSV